MTEREKTGFIMSDKAYNLLKWIVLIFLPAFSAFYFSMSQIWGVFPAAEQVVGTCAVVATFIGGLIGLSGRNYHKSGIEFDGKVVTSHADDGHVIYGLELDEDPAELETKDKISFKVEHKDVLPDGFDMPDAK